MSTNLSLAGVLVRAKRKLALRTRFLQSFKWFKWKFGQKFIKSRLGIEPVRNFLIDRKYGGWCGGKFQTRFAETGAHGTSSADYYQLQRLFCTENGIIITRDDVLVDVGCGRGRVLNWWLSLGLGNKIIGIELDERFASEAAQRLKRYSNVTLISGDAVQHIPEDATIFHLFNPFNHHVMEAFKNRLFELYKDKKNITVVYQFSRHLDVWKSDPRWTVEMARTKTYYQCAIIRMRSRMQEDLEPVSETEGYLATEEAISPTNKPL